MPYSKQTESPLIMTRMECPDCRSPGFYVKDPEDQYNVCDFTMKDGEIVFTNLESESDVLEVSDDNETFCCRYAWHDKLKTLTQL
jgi:hypothetical protein